MLSKRFHWYPHLIKYDNDKPLYGLIHRIYHLWLKVYFPLHVEVSSRVADKQSSGCSEKGTRMHTSTRRTNLSRLLCCEAFLVAVRLCIIFRSKAVVIIEYTRVLSNHKSSRSSKRHHCGFALVRLDDVVGDRWVRHHDVTTDSIWTHVR